MQIKNTETIKDVQKIKEFSRDERSLNKVEGEITSKITKQDTVLISDKAKEKLNDYKKEYFNENKVNEIKEKIINGTYEINYKNIANKILELDI